MSAFRWIHINNKEELELFYVSILPNIREAAKKCGYAIGLHGSLRRDLDLIAVPWVEDHTDKDRLASDIQLVSCGMQSQAYQWEQKPLGRVATAFPVCWTWYEEPMILSNGHIDLSVIEGRYQLAGSTTKDGSHEVWKRSAKIMDMRECEKRFRTDPAFHAMVTVINNALEQMVLSPSEVREAAMMACFYFELKHPKPIFFDEMRGV